MMDVYEAICKRRTIRKFRQDPIPRSILTKLVKAARLAPSGGNKQAWNFIIVDNSDLVKKIFPLVKWAAYLLDEGKPKNGEEPTAYIAVSIKEKDSITPVADVSAAIMNIILTGVELSLGSCWMGAIDREKISQLLKLPAEYTLKYMIAIGYPAEAPEIKEATNSTKYYLDKSKTLKVPKKKLNQIASFNGYKKL